MIKPILATAFLFIAPLPLIAETREDRLAVADEYITATVADLDIKAMIRIMWKPVVEQMQATGKPLSQMQIDRIDALYQETFTRQMEELLLAQAEVMADVFTMEEVTAMRDFYATEHGRAAMRKLPQVLEYQQPMIQELLAATIPLILPRIREIIANP